VSFIEPVSLTTRAREKLEYAFLVHGLKGKIQAKRDGADPPFLALPAPWLGPFCETRCPYVTHIASCQL